MSVFPADIPNASGHPHYVVWCFRCKKRVALVNPVFVKLENGRRAAKGICQECGSRLSRLVR